jgi:hypothetical protein
MTLMTSQHPNARLSSPRNARNAAQSSSLVSSKRRIFSIVSSRKTTTRVKSFRDENDVESYQTVANPLEYTATEREAMDGKKLFTVAKTLTRVARFITLGRVGDQTLERFRRERFC